MSPPSPAPTFRFTPTSRPKAAAVALWSRLSCLFSQFERRFTVAIPRLRVALVKQVTYADLYTLPLEKNPIEQLRHTLHRTGPLGLFTLFDTDFMIVRNESDPECRVWEEKLPGWQRESFRWNDRQRDFALQDRRCVDAESVDWSAYDLVIAIENAVPARITKRFPATLWATLLEHHRMSPYSRYRTQPPTGYDVFFNQLVGANPLTPLRKIHDIEWPYSFTPPGLYVKLFPTVPRQSRVYHEAHQNAEALQNALGTGLEVTTQRGSAFEMVQTLLGCHYFAAPGALRPVYGNAFVDAAAADSIIVGNPDPVINPVLIPQPLRVRGVKATAELLKRLNRQKASEHQERLDAQRQTLHWNLIERPLLQLSRFAQSLKGKRDLRFPALDGQPITR